MREPVSRGPLFFAACLCVVGSIAAVQDASGQSCPDAGLTQAPYVVPKSATCAPSQYLANASDADTAIDAPGPSTWSGPQPYDASPTTFNGDIFQALCIQNPNAVTFSYESLRAPYADGAGCKAFDNQGHQAAHDCLCDSCFSLVQQCDAIPGCRAIAKCAWDSGCTSAQSCYLLPGAPCVSVIDRWGTGSVSTGLQSALNTCGTTNNCPAQ